MAGRVQQVEQKLAAIEQFSQALANELYEAFGNYLKTLANAVKKQLILASYHLCTQGYPEAFLGLSLQKKQELQGAIRRLTLTAEHEFSVLLPLSLKVEQNVQNKTENSMAEGEGSEETDKIDESDDVDDGNIDNESEEMMPLASLVLTNPEQISHWYQKIEQVILEILQTSSRKANSSLQKYKILPNNLPGVLLESAAKSSRYAESVGDMPNILNLTIELGNPEEAEKSRNREAKPKDSINFWTIQLRLSDLEFADPLLMAGRNQIRQQSNRLNLMLKEYQAKQQELTIAEAEAAWRSSWFEE